MNKWTEIEHLPEWDEDFYDVYTAKKFGKWVMLKTLKAEYASLPEYQKMLHREFEVRYNLAHAHIIMINDLEEVPGVGLSIITDDVYGLSLDKLIQKGEVTPAIVKKIAKNLPDAIDYMQVNHIVHHPITTSSVIFTDKIQNLKVINVGFDQKHTLAPAEVTDDIRHFGNVLLAALEACPNAENYGRLYEVAERCRGPHPYRTIQQLQMAINGNSVYRLYIAIIAFLALMVGILTYLIIALRK